MRFRAEVSNHLIFTKLVQSVEKLSKRMVLKLTKEKVHLICTGREAEGIQVWSCVRSWLM